MALTVGSNGVVNGDCGVICLLCYEWFYKWSRGGQLWLFWVAICLDQRLVCCFGFSGIGGCGVCCGWVWWFKSRFSAGVRDLRVDRWSYCFWVLSCMLIVWVMRARWYVGWCWDCGFDVSGCDVWVLVSLMSSGYAVGLLMEFYDAVSWRFLGLGGISRRLDSLNDLFMALMCLSLMVWWIGLVLGFEWVGVIVWLIGSRGN